MDRFNKMPKAIRYEYIVPEDMHEFQAHGVWGGVNPHGQVEMNFYTEGDKLPKISQRQVLPDGSVGPEVPLMDENVRVVSRRFQSKVLLNVEAARAIISWLEDKIDMMEAEKAVPILGPESEEGPTQ